MRPADGRPATGWTGLSVLVNHVDGLTAGGYRYDLGQLQLRPAVPARRPWPEILARVAGPLSNYSLDQAAAVLVVTGRTEAVLAHHGPRGFRLLNAEAGGLLQTAYLAATAGGLGCGAVLNLDHREIDDLLCLTGTDERSIVCLMIGRERRGDADFDHWLI